MMSCPSPVMNHLETKSFTGSHSCALHPCKGLDLYMQHDHFLISKQAQYYSALAPNLISDLQGYSPGYSSSLSSTNNGSLQQTRH